MSTIMLSRLSRQLGLAGGPLLVRIFCVREVAAGLTVLAKPDHTSGPASRVVGDMLDIAVLAHGLRPSNPRRVSAKVALVLVFGRDGTGRTVHLCTRQE